MFLSSLLIDVGSNPDRPRPGRLWLGNVYRVHQRLCMAFPSMERKMADPQFLQPYRPEAFAQRAVGVARTADSGFLFRIDPLPGNRAVILVQSALRPDWEYAFHNASYLLVAEPQCRPFDPESTQGERLRFRLRANPTKKVGSATKSERLAGKKKNGKRIALLHEHDQIAWLLEKGQQGGFIIPGEWREENGVKIPDFRVDVVPQGSVRLGKEGRRDGDFFAVRFDGILVVNDVSVFCQTLQQGIGSAKAFGFGLLSIAPAESLP
jgi:CRISPR system Cascade subunit CasE